MKYRRYAEYKHSGVEWLGEVPAHWGLIPLKYGTSVELSNVDKKTVDDQQNVYLCNYLDVYRNERITADLSFMLASAADEQIERLSLKRGDVIITKDSESPDDIGIPALVEENLAGVVCGYHLALIRPVASIMDSRFLLRYLQGSFARAYFAVQAVGMTRYGLGKSSITGTMVVAPPIEEQQAISAFLDRETAQIDALIAKQERLIAVLQEKRQALISHAVTKGLNPDAPMKDSGVEWLGQVPAHWEVLKGNYFLDLVGGVTPNEADLSYESGFGYYKVDDLNQIGDGMYLGASDMAIRRESPSRLVSPPVVLIPKRGAAIATNKVRISSQPCNFDSNIMGIRIINPAVTVDYFAQVLLSRGLWDIADVSTVPQINNKHIYPMQFPVPPVQDQLEIITYVDQETAKIAALVSAASKSIELLKERRSALISAAGTGKIDVRNQLN